VGVHRAHVAAIEEHEAHDRHDRQRGDLQHRGHDDRRADRPRADQVVEHRQDQDDRREGRRGPAAATRAEQRREVTGAGDRDRGVAGPALDPVRPRGEEARERPERVVGVDVRPAGAARAAHEAGERERDRHAAEPDDDERRDRQPPVVGDRGGHGEDPGPDDPADHQRDRCRQPEPMVGLRLGREVRGRDGGGAHPGADCPAAAARDARMCVRRPARRGSG
jgi:hypothetical protein